MNSTAKITFKNVTYLVSDSLPHDKDEAYYESFFNREAILASEDTECKGGRGSTLLYKHDSRDLVLRHYCRGGMIGKVISDVKFTAIAPSMNSGYLRICFYWDCLYLSP